MIFIYISQSEYFYELIIIHPIVSVLVACMEDIVDVVISCVLLQTHLLERHS